MREHKYFYWDIHTHNISVEVCNCVLLSFPHSPDVDPLDHPGNLTRTFPRDRDPRSSTTSHAQPRELEEEGGEGGGGGEEGEMGRRGRREGREGEERGGRDKYFLYFLAFKAVRRLF